MAVETAARLRRSPRLSLAVRAPRLSGPAGVIVGALLIVPAWLAVTVAHELLIVALALLLPALAGLPFLEPLIASLPVNYVYASAMVRYAGQIEPSGLALTGPIGASLAAHVPAVFFDPAFVAGEGLASAVLAPGSSLLARALATGVINVGLIALGLAVALRAARLGRGATALVDLRGRAALLMALALLLQVEVVARVLRTAGATRDLESLGILPFLFHQVLRLHTDVYDRVTFHMGRLLDPVFAEVVLIGLYGAVVAGWLLWRVLRGAPSWARTPSAARGWAREPAAARPAAVGAARLALDGALLAVLVAALPIVDGAVSEPRFLDWEIGQAAEVIPSDVLVVQSAGAELKGAPASTSPGAGLAPPAQSALAPLAPPAAGAPPAAAPSAAVAPPAGPKIVRPAVVGIGGVGLSFSYVVDGVPTEFRGMGYNVTHAALPPAERADRLRTDFALMRDVGVNHVLGWRTSEWDEPVLDAAHAAGIGVVMPFDLDDKLDYSDRAVRSRLRGEILAWVARYRGHPAIRMWGIGNETLLHMKQSARARAFADFYTGTVDLVRQFDPDHPVLYREAEDVYVRWLQESWRTTGGPPPGFVIGMNFYTFRMKDALADWPKKELDVPLIISEFAPAGVGRADRPAGYWRMWSLIRARPELVLGAAPYVWAIDGPEPADRLFGLTDGNGKAVDSTLAALKDLYRSAATPDPGALPALVGLRLGEAQALLASRNVAAASVEYWQSTDARATALHRRYGAGRVLHQERAPGGQVHLAVAAAPPQSEWPRGRPRPD
jgi:hypothetical protein